MGRLISLTGVLILSIGLICNGFEVISAAAFRVIVLVGIMVQVAALVCSLKKKEF